MAAVIKDLLAKTKEKLEKAGTDSPAFNSLCLIEKAFGLTQSDIIADSSLTVEDTSEFDKMVERRLNGEPLQYILGEWEFYGCRLKVGKGVLIPRDDTEVLLRACLTELKRLPDARVIDLCAGSGALAIAIAKQVECQIFAVEKSPKALPYLRENIALNGVDVNVLEGDVLTCCDEYADGFFDLILSNPPYIRTDEIAGLQREVVFEPQMALDGGEDGLLFYRAIIKDWARKLRVGGRLAFELGEGQFDKVESLMKAAGFVEIQAFYDFGGTRRAVIGTLLAK